MAPGHDEMYRSRVSFDQLVPFIELAKNCGLSVTVHVNVVDFDPMNGETDAFVSTEPPLPNGEASRECADAGGTSSSWVKTMLAIGATAIRITRPESARYLGRFSPTQTGSASATSSIAGMASRVAT